MYRHYNEDNNTNDGSFQYSSARILHKEEEEPAAKHSKLTIPHSKSSESQSTSNNDPPNLKDVSSQDSDTPAAEFKRWSKQQKMQALRKAKAQTPKEGAARNTTATHGKNSNTRQASTSFPYGNAPPAHPHTYDKYQSAGYYAVNIAAANYANEHAHHQPTTAHQPHSTATRHVHHAAVSHKHNAYYAVPPPPHHQHHQHQPQTSQSQQYSSSHHRDRSQVSQISQYSVASISESGHTLASIPGQSHLLNNNISSSSEDFIKENISGRQPSYDYTSPSPTQNVSKLWQQQSNGAAGYALNSNLSNKSKDSVSTINSVASTMKTSHQHHAAAANNNNTNGGAASVHHNSGYNHLQNQYMSSVSAVYYELDGKVQFLQRHDIRPLLSVCNEMMVKVSLEFVGFDVENPKFAPFYTQLQERLKVRNSSGLSLQTSSNMTYFGYSGEALINYLKQVTQMLSVYLQNPNSMGNDLNIVLSLLLPRKASMSQYSVLAIYQLCHEYRSTHKKLQTMTDKLDVVKNLFNEDFNITPPVRKKQTITSSVGSPTETPRSNMATTGTRTRNDTLGTDIDGITPKYARLKGHLFPADSDNSNTHHLQQQQHSQPPPHGPPQHQRLQRAQRQVSAPQHAMTNPVPVPIHHSKSHGDTPSDRNKAILTKSRNDKSEDEKSSDAEYKDARESTPVLSDIDDIDRHLGNSADAYDSDIQSEMSATPQPADIQNAIIKQFVPNSVGAAMKNKSSSNIQAITEDLQSNLQPILNDAVEAAVPPGSGDSGNDSKQAQDNKRWSQKIIVPVSMEQLRPSSKSKMEEENERQMAHSDTPMPDKRTGKKRRQSWAEQVAMEKIDVYVSNEKREFTMIKPINQQQGVDNMIKEYRKSLGQNELKESVDALRNEFASNSEDDIIDVNEQSDTTSSNREEEEEFIDDDNVEAMRAKYYQMTTPVTKTPMGNDTPKSPLDLMAINSNDTTSSRYESSNAKQKSNNNLNNNAILDKYNQVIPEGKSSKSSHSHSRRSRSNGNVNVNGKRGSSHGSHRSQHSHKSKHSHKSDSNQSNGLHEKAEEDENNKPGYKRRPSDPTLLRRFTDETIGTVASASRRNHNQMPLPTPNNPDSPRR